MKWWQIGKRNADLERELQSDLELEEEEQRERGIAPQEARYAALRAFGNPSVIHNILGNWVRGPITNLRSCPAIRSSFSPTYNPKHRDRANVRSG
jgi:hypothetical protein